MKGSIHCVYSYGYFCKFTKGNIIKISEMNRIQKWLTPHYCSKSYSEIYKELEELKFIKRIDREKYELLPVKIKPYTDYYGKPLW